MRPVLALLVALASSTACSTTHVIARPTSLEELGDATREEGGGVDLALASPIAPPADSDAAPGVEAPDGHRVSKLALVEVRTDGALVTGHGSPRLLQLADLRGYDVTHHGEGALDGGGIGLLAGVAVGALAGFASGDDPPCDQNEFLGCLFHMTAGDKALVGGVVGAVTGAVSGLVIGAIVGHTDHYVFAGEAP